MSSLSQCEACVCMGKSLAVRDERKCTHAKTVKMVEVGFTMQASSHRTAGGQSSMVRWCESWRSGKGFWRGLDPNLGKGIDLTRSSPGPRTGCIYIEFTSISKQGAAPAVLARHETRFHVTLHQAPSPLHWYTSGTPRACSGAPLLHLWYTSGTPHPRSGTTRPCSGTLSKLPIQPS